MPELPEVETVKRSLAASIVGKKIRQVSINYTGNIRQPEPELFRAMLQGKEFLQVKRRGKYIIFLLSEELALVVHLRMTGQLVLVNSDAALGKHTHLVFHLSNNQELRFIDMRKFGTVDLIRREDLGEMKGLSKLGLEPLSAEFTLSWLAASLKKKNRPIKACLLDQTIIAGIGNIYADEILFEAGIHPEKICMELTKQEMGKLYRGIVNILNLGIKHRGTSIRNYVDGEGQQGQFQDLLKVYGRHEEPCTNCGVFITKTKLVGRGTYYCSRCQIKD